MRPLWLDPVAPAAPLRAGALGFNYHPNLMAERGKVAHYVARPGEDSGHGDGTVAN